MGGWRFGFSISGVPATPTFAMFLSVQEKIIIPLFRHSREHKALGIAGKSPEGNEDLQRIARPKGNALEISLA